MSDIGATSPGRWHATHLAYMIGATSALNVGAAADAEAEAGCCGAPIVTVDVIPSQTIPTNRRTRARPSNLLSLMRYTFRLRQGYGGTSLLIPRQRRAVRYRVVHRTRRIPSLHKPY